MSTDTRVMARLKALGYSIRRTPAGWCVKGKGRTFLVTFACRLAALVNQLEAEAT